MSGEKVWSSELGSISIDTVIDALCNTIWNSLLAALILAKVQLRGLEQTGPLLWTAQCAVLAWTLAVVVFRLSRARRCRSTLDWREQIVVVSGSSGGLGRALIDELQQNGCRTVAVDIKDDEDDDGKAATESSMHLFIKADVSDRSAVAKLPSIVKDKFGKSATIVISNAGVMVGKRVLDFDEGQFERTIAINLHATYYLVRAFLPDMISAGTGHVSAVSSIMGYISISQLSDYVASKHALIGFMESLQLEIDKKYKVPGINTTLLILGKLATPLFARTEISPLSQFLTPTQHPTRVAQALIAQIERGQRGRIYMPYLARLAPVLKGMPDWVRNTVQRLSGADEALQAIAS